LFKPGVFPFTVTRMRRMRLPCGEHLFTNKFYFDEKIKSRRYLLMSLCVTFAGNLCLASARRTDSASITERCLPPVQPNAIVK
jgi:hypothetical protein